jgi:hypothetical protein
MTGLVQERLKLLQPELVIRLWRKSTLHLFEYLIFKRLWGKMTIKARDGKMTRKVCD